jgi:hypothetical protein
MTREIDLLLAVASWEVTPQRVARIRDAVAGVHWERWLSLVEAHRLVPHAHRQLRGAAVSMPDQVRSRFDAAAGDAAIRGLALVRERDAVAGILADANVQAIGFKGPSLALAAYGDAGSRPSIDLDFVVAPASLAQALAALREAGFRSRHAMSAAQERALQTSFGHVEYERPGGVATIELHTAFSRPRFPWTMPVEDVARRASWDGPRGVSTLDPVDEALLQVMHGARHHWQQLEWLVAFAAVVDRSGVDLLRLAERAARHGATRALRVALRLADLLLSWRGTNASAGLAAIDADADALAREIESAARRGNPEAWIASPLRFDLRHLDSGADRARYLMHSVFDPTLREWELVKLPDALLPLYYPIRLARLALKPFVRR